MRRSGELTISIEDDGKGFDPHFVQTGGMGLRIMKYRAKMISGKLEVRRRQAGGTVVTCSCLLRPVTQDKEMLYERRNNQTIGNENSQSPSPARR
jgi:nitrate/nitrite-specific signal transduction histidine kinase